jgi:hypothetical protein
LLALVLLLATADPLTAQTPRWEYQVVSAKLKNRPLAEMLNSRGAEGWELVALTRGDVAIFKRPMR